MNFFEYILGLIFGEMVSEFFKKHRWLEFFSIVVIIVLVIFAVNR